MPRQRELLTYGQVAAMEFAAQRREKVMATKIHSIKNVVHYDVSVDDKRYAVRHSTYPQAWHASNKEYWTVEGGGNSRSHICDNDGATHKRVVRAVKDAIKERETEAVEKAQERTGVYYDGYGIG
jgi:hypothetical protein